MALRDPDAFRHFYDRTFDPVYRFAYALAGEEAEAEKSVAALYADAWLTWRRLPRAADEVPELLDELFAENYEAFVRKHRLIHGSEEIARLIAATIHRRWTQKSTELRAAARPAPERQVRLLGPADEEADEEHDGADLSSDAEEPSILAGGSAEANGLAEPGEAGVAPAGGRGEMSNWRRVRW